MGTPSTFTQAKGDEIIRLVEEGNYPHIAARSVGVPKRTMNLWRQKGRDYQDALDKGEDPNPAHEVLWNFYLRMEQAKGKQVVNLNAKLNDNDCKNPNAHIWRMKKLAPNEYGDNEDMTGLDKRLAENERIREAGKSISDETRAKLGPIAEEIAEQIAEDEE